MAKAIHHKSRRNSELFITVHCDQSEERLEYELFGAEGALNRASRGTLFLYEIGDMPLSVQARLLSELDAGLSARIIASKARRILVIPAQKIRSAKIYFTGFTCYAFRSLLYLNEKRYTASSASIC